MDELLGTAYRLVKEHQLSEAIGCLEQALALDFDNAEVLSSLKFANFWRERQETAARIANDFERAEYRVGQWPAFLQFAERVGNTSERCYYALRQHVFGGALAIYEQLLEETDGNDPELLIRVGRCRKRIGDYDGARQRLEAAAKVRKEDAEVLAELADCYALVSETQRAKAFFREAFFIAPARVEVGSLESELIWRLFQKVEELGYKGQAALEWVPVYGVLFGVFNVKRELRSIEYGKLRQSIYALEREIHEQHDSYESQNILKPRLINRYFWLIDHYVHAGEDRSKINEVLLKIRELSMKVYQYYTN